MPAHAQTVPPYYILDAHLHPVTVGIDTAVYERTPQGVCATSLGDSITAPGAKKTGCGGEYYDYPTVLSLVVQNMHDPTTSNIKRSLALGSAKARPKGYSADSSLCTQQTTCNSGGGNCEASRFFQAGKLPDNTPDLRFLNAASNLTGSDPDAIKATIAAFGACDTTSPNYVAANAPLFRWAGEMDRCCWYFQLVQPTGPSAEVKVLLASLRNWDGVHHGTVLSTHLPNATINRSGFDTTTGTCAAGDSECDSFKAALEEACGQKRLVVHQTHGHTFWGDLGTANKRDALPFLKYWFNRYDSETEGYYMIDIQYASTPTSCPLRLNDPYCKGAAQAVSDTIIDFLLDPLVSRHITVSTHQYPGNDFQGSGRFGTDYVDYTAYWDEIFRKMVAYAPTKWPGDPAASTKACEAIQNISHGNAERFLLIAPLPGYGCTAGDFVAGAGSGSSNPPDFRSYRFDGRVTEATDGFATAYGTTQYGVDVAAGDIGEPAPNRGASILTGPGPGPAYGSQVRGWNFGGTQTGSTSIAAVNFYAYNTQAYGVNVAEGDIDNDGWKEILTGPGPGSVFGPQVRGWNYDGGTVQAIPAVDFWAYPQIGYGANVGSGDVTGDTAAEILTGRGPDSSKDSEVRIFTYSGTVSLWRSFQAYLGANYGVHVGSIQLDGGTEEIVTGPGPGPSNPSDIKVFKWEGFPASWNEKTVIGLFPDTKYGADADSAWLADCGTGTPCDAALAGQGADPSALSEVDAARYDAAANLLRRIPGANAMTFYSNRSEGIHVDGLDQGESFPLPLQGFRADNSPAVARSAWGGDSTLLDELLVLIRLVGMTPDSTTVDPMVDPEADLDINVWTDDADKAAVETALVDLYRRFATVTTDEAVTILTKVQGYLGSSLTNPTTERALMDVTGRLLARIQGR